MRNLGRVKISVGLLEELIHLPPGHNILEVNQDWTGRCCTEFEIIVEGPDLPKCPEGHQIPVVELVHEKIYSHFKTN